MAELVRSDFFDALVKFHRRATAVEDRVANRLRQREAHTLEERDNIVWTGRFC